MYFEYWQPIEVKVRNGWFDYLIPFIAGGLGAWLSHLLTVKRTYKFNEAIKEEQKIQDKLRFYHQLKVQDLTYTFYDQSKHNLHSKRKEYFNWEAFKREGEVRKTINENFHLLETKAADVLHEVNQFEQTHLLTNEEKYQDEYIELLYKLYTVVFVDIDKEFG